MDDFVESQCHPRYRAEAEAVKEKRREKIRTLAQLQRWAMKRGLWPSIVFVPYRIESGNNIYYTIR